MADRFFEHPASVLVLTNLAYAMRVARGEIAQCGVEPGLARAAADRQFGAQLRAADHRSGILPRPELAAGVSARTGKPGLRASGRAGHLSRGHRFLLDRSFRNPAAPSPITTSSSPRSPIAARIVTSAQPRDRAAGARARPRGRLIAIHSHGHDPGMEIIQRVWRRQSVHP